MKDFLVKSKEFIKKRYKEVKKECVDLKNKIAKTTATKLFWCETLIIVAFLLFTITNFMLNFFVGMYILSFSLLGIGIFTWKYL